MKGFSDKIIGWYKENARDLPWRKTKDPYKIWLSEVILQQTRVEQGRPYYENFVREFPTVIELAKAPEKKVMKLWQGLGYYSRARNLQTAAKQIVGAYKKGGFPDNFIDLIQLKGVGRYTAAAISSIAFGEPRAVVDGNVYRVLARIFGLKTPIDTSGGKEAFQSLADQLISKKRPGDHNQAMMEFGATICTPKNPKCSGCLFSEMCYAMAQNNQNELPVKSKKIKVRERFFYYFEIFYKGNVFIHRRENTKDIWNGLYELPLLEFDKRPRDEGVVLKRLSNEILGEGGLITICGEWKYYKHVLTHQKIHACIVPVKISRLPDKLAWLNLRVPKKNINLYPLPRLLDKYWNGN